MKQHLFILIDQQSWQKYLDKKKKKMEKEENFKEETRIKKYYNRYQVLRCLW